MNMNQKGFTNIVLIVVIVAIVAVGGYFVFVKKSEPIAQQQPISKNETVNWKTYTNSHYGFELALPASWKAEDIVNRVDGGQDYTAFSSSETQQKTIAENERCKAPNCDSEYSAYDFIFMYQSKSGVGGADTGTVKKEQIGTTVFTRYVISGMSTFDVYEVVYNGHIFSFSTSDNKTAKDYLHQILSTFKFTN